MDSARTSSGSTINADQVITRNIKYYCTSCGRRVYYNKGSGGRNPYFYHRPANPDCIFDRSGGEWGDSKGNTSSPTSFYNDQDSDNRIKNRIYYQNHSYSSSAQSTESMTQSSDLFSIISSTFNGNNKKNLKLVFGAILAINMLMILAASNNDFYSDLIILGGGLMTLAFIIDCYGSSKITYYTAITGLIFGIFMLDDSSMLLSTMLTIPLVLISHRFGKLLVK